MNQILQQILKLKDWEKKYNYFARKNNLNSINFKLVKQQNFQNFQNFIQAIVQKGPRKSKKRWVSNQRRILHILLTCISVMQNISVGEFKEEQIQRINRVFPYKDSYSIGYQLRKLVTNSKQNRRRWSEKQEEILEEIVKKTQNKSKWNQIARDLFTFSKGQYFRQGKHCRQIFYKLKQRKGQQQLSQQIQCSSENKLQNYSQFHIHSSNKSVKIKLNMSQNCEKQENVNSRNSDVKRQVDHGEKVAISNQQEQIILKSKSKQDEIIGFTDNKIKSTQLSFEQENVIFNQEQIERNINLKRQNEVLSPFLQDNSFMALQVVSTQNKHGTVLNMADPASVGQENIMAGYFYNPILVSWQNSHHINQNGPANQVWPDISNLYSHYGFPFDYQGFY